MPDLTVFTSSSAVIGLVAALGEEAGRTLLGRTAVAALGPITARTVASFGKKPEIVPRESTILALVQSIRDFYLQSGPDS
jgi:uroporphyrinogen III methyltransferase/synthase